VERHVAAMRQTRSSDEQTAALLRRRLPFDP
jgi:hypothetical protein